MNNRFLTLVRHAKSSWKVADQTDHERQLSKRGITDAPDMAKRLLQRQCTPDLILCSSAVRTQQTAQIFMSILGVEDDKLRLGRQLYLCTPETILEQLASAEEGHKHIMVIGHNPGLEQLSLLLSPLCSPQMPTLGIRHFSCSSFHHLPIGGHYQPPDIDTKNEDAEKVKLIFEDFPKNS